jgi:hypothetical protein
LALKNKSKKINMKKTNIALTNISLATMVAFIIFINSIDKGEVWRIVFSSVSLLIFVFLLISVLVNKNKLKKQEILNKK